MEKELNINVKINSAFDMKVITNLKHWNDATDEQRGIYVKDKVRDYLLEQIDDIIEDLMDDVKFNFE